MWWRPAPCCRSSRRWRWKGGCWGWRAGLQRAGGPGAGGRAGGALHPGGTLRRRRRAAGQSVRLAGTGGGSGAGQPDAAAAGRPCAAAAAARLLHRLAALVPEERRAEPEVAALLAEAGPPARAIVLRIGYRAPPDEAGAGKLFDFSRATTADRWQAGRRPCAGACASWRKRRPPAPAWCCTTSRPEATEGRMARAVSRACLVPWSCRQRQPPRRC
ncbi:DUF3734 domain-containing protein [Pseudoroseomonas wenyumeiae]